MKVRFSALLTGFQNLLPKFSTNRSSLWSKECWKHHICQSNFDLLKLILGLCRPRSATCIPTKHPRVKGLNPSWSILTLHTWGTATWRSALWVSTVASGSPTLLDLMNGLWNIQIRDFQMSGRGRVVLKPTTKSLPLVGGLQLCFLEPPAIDFDLDGIADICDWPILRRKVYITFTTSFFSPSSHTLRYSRCAKKSGKTQPRRVFTQTD